ncbi:hypothetical protein AB0E59_06365, partial [Lentzea sp. NPDC034063]|uniref:hypothetical protein n=1 Tax=Lentzea sp. NPDC034063 TaxID=3154912 RepID=UPI0033D727DE
MFGDGTETGTGVVIGAAAGEILPANWTVVSSSAVKPTAVRVRWTFMTATLAGTDEEPVYVPLDCREGLHTSHCV